MSFLSWFGKKEKGSESLPEPSSDLGQVDITVPINRLTHLHLPPDRSTDGGSRRGERMERRELLYGVVRECMTAAGVLSSSYKFKVLSMDSSGRKYLIMVDMPREYLVNPAHFVETEGAIARSAKERYDLLVTAVYWRVNDMVSAARQQTQADAVPAIEQKADPSASRAAPPAQEHRPYPPLQQEEVLAFKRAIAAAANGVPRSETRKTARNPSGQVPDFSNTEPFDALAPLGASQFGGLNE